MTLENEAKDFIEKKQPWALQCNSCKSWSAYNKIHETELPRGWIETDKGYKCKNCKHGKKRKL